MNKFPLFFIISISLVIQVHSKTIYVSLQGNDKNIGTIEYPLKSITRAIKELESSRGNDTIYIRQGEYAQYKSIFLKNRGNVVIQPYKNEKVVITGGFSSTNNIVKKITDSQILSRLNEKIRNNVYLIDLNTINIHLVDIIKKGFGRASTPSWNELFIDYIPMQLARWPNDSMIPIKKVVKQGNIISKNITNQEETIFEYEEARPDFWNSDENIWIGGYFGEGWCDEFLPISSINKENKTIIIDESSYYGFKADGKYRRWYAANILEELDRPSEYVLNKENNHIYFLPPANDFKKVQISILNDPIIKIDSCHNIILKNLNIECSRGMGVNIHASNNIIIDSCNLRNLGHIGIKIHGDINSYNNVVKNTNICQTSAGGIILNGGDRQTLRSGNNKIINCEIHNFNRNERSYRPGIEIQGVGNTVLNVEIYDAPSNAIILKGNNHIVKYANIHHVCQEINDQGAIYYGRNPTERGHQILYSYIHGMHTPYISRGIYHDDGACAMTVKGCILKDFSFTPIEIGGGQDINYINNIFINQPYAIKIDNRLKTWANEWLQPNGDYEKKFQAINYNQPPYSEAYPELLSYWTDDPTTPKRNVISNNVFYNVKNLVEGKMEYLEWGRNWDTKENPGFKNSNNPLEGIDYEIIRIHLPDFKEIPLDSIGCHL